MTERYPETIIDAVAGAQRCSWAIAELDHPKGHLCRIEHACRDKAIRVIDALVEATGGAEHIARFTDDSFILQHPITERLAGTLFDCEFTAMLAAQDNPPNGETGTFRITRNGWDGSPRAERIGEADDV